MKVGIKKAKMAIYPILLWRLTHSAWKVFKVFGKIIQPCVNIYQCEQRTYQKSITLNSINYSILSDAQERGSQVSHPTDFSGWFWFWLIPLVDRSHGLIWWPIWFWTDPISRYLIAEDWSDWLNLIWFWTDLIMRLIWIRLWLIWSVDRQTDTILTKRASAAPSIALLWEK